MDNRLIILLIDLLMNKGRVFRNLVCASIGLLLFFFLSIFVIKGIYQTQIDHLIDETTLLKEYLV